MEENRKVPRILVIAGSDSSGGAGIQADIKTITMLGGYAMTAITAITAQNTTGVTAIEVLEPEMVTAQIDACVSDIGVDAVKIGMLGSPEIAGAVSARIDTLACPVVFDPVMVASSGAQLADDETIAVFETLMSMSTLVTPNVAELQTLVRGDDLSGEALRDAAQLLALRFGTGVLAKGGHDAVESDLVQDWLTLPDGEPTLFSHERLSSDNTHGTGCTLASAIACLLGHGVPLESAVRVAREFVLRAIAAAPGFGAGSGPLGHQAVRGN